MRCKQGNINTLGQSRTAKFGKQTEKIKIAGFGTSIADEDTLLKRAKKKVITNALLMALVDVAKENDEVNWQRRYWRSYHCQNTLVEYEGRLFTEYCKNRWCTTCCGIRKAELINKYYETLLSWEEPHLLTLTLRTVKADDLSKRIDDMVQAFSRIKNRCDKRIKRVNGMKIMGIKSLESNFNAVKGWYNPHYHIITPNRKIALYIKQEWRKEWNKNGVYLACEDYQDIRPINKVEKGLIECIKYGAKMLSDPDPSKKRKRRKGDLEGLNIYAKALHNIYKAFDGHQLFKSFGFNLPPNELIASFNITTRNYAVWKYRIKEMDWINIKTGRQLTEYEIDEKLMLLLKTSIDVNLY